MSVILYRQGNTHKERGVDCEIKLVKPKNFNGQPDEGWFLSPEAAYGVQEKKTDEEKQKEIAENLKIHEQKAKEKRIKSLLIDVDIDAVENKNLRILARKCSIDNWDDARFKTLREALKKCQQEI